MAHSDLKAAYTPEGLQPKESETQTPRLESAKEPVGEFAPVCPQVLTVVRPKAQAKSLQHIKVKVVYHYSARTVGGPRPRLAQGKLVVFPEMHVTRVQLFNGIKRREVPMGGQAYLGEGGPERPAPVPAPRPGPSSDKSKCVVIDPCSPHLPPVARQGCI